MTTRTMAREDLGRPRDRRRPALHRPAPRPRGLEPAGVRGPAARRPHACGASTARSRRPTTTCRRGSSRARSRTRSRRRSSTRSTRNVEEFGVPYYGLGHARQGIVHVIGPELGITQPGMTIVCGDSHTSTHGAFGALAFGIGTSEVEHVLATQTLAAEARARRCASRSTGLPGRGVGAKDLILGLIAQETSAGATGHVVEYDGEAIRALSMEGRMTVSNMSIEWGARAGLIAPDDDDLRLPRGPAGRAGAVRRERRALVALRQRRRRRLRPRDRASTPPRSRRRSRGARTPARRCRSPARVPEPRDEGEQRALDYMGLTAGTPMQDVAVDRVFIGSLHEQPARRPAGRGRGRARQARGGRRAGARRPGLDARQGRGRGRGSRPGLHGRRLRVAQRRLLDVPRHESRRRGRRRARRLDEQPQLRGPSGPRRAHAPDGAGDGRRRRADRPPHRRPRAVHEQARRQGRADHRRGIRHRAGDRRAVRRGGRAASPAPTGAPMRRERPPRASAAVRSASSST